MVALPSLEPTKAKAQIFGHAAYHIGAETVPVLTVDVTKTGVYFEHPTLLWKHPAVKITVRPPNGGVRRRLAGAQVYIADARGPGMIAFSRDGPGRVVTFQMPFGRELEVREHQFLAATAEISHASVHVKTASNMLNASQGSFVDHFHCLKGDGVLWVYAYGQIFEKLLKGGESIDVEPGAWLYKETTVRMETRVDRFTSGAFGGHANMVVNRFTGPGRIGVQSMNLHHAGEA